MGKNKAHFETVRKIGLTFPGVCLSTAYGSPALKLKGKLLACLASHRSAEPGSLVVCVSLDDRAALIAEAPDVYYLKQHYVNYSCVLVRLSRVGPEVLRDLLAMAYKFVGQKAQNRRRSKKQPSPRAKS